MSLDDLIDAVAVFSRHRRHCIQMQSKCDRSTEALIASMLGYKTTNAGKGDEHQPLTAAQRKKLFDQAKKIRLRIEKADADTDWREFSEQGSKVAVLVNISASARAAFDAYREGVEAEMKKLAKQLPAWPFVKTVTGVAELGLAVIIGETGNLNLYANPGKLHKRLGLALDKDGKRQQKRQGEMGKLYPYNPRRRSEIFVFVEDQFQRHQWTSEKDGIPAHATGPYGELYGRKKVEYLAREWTPAHANRAALRYAAKCFIVDLWRAWRENAVVDVPVDRSLFYQRAIAADRCSVETQTATESSDGAAELAEAEIA